MANLRFSDNKPITMLMKHLFLTLFIFLYLSVQAQTSEAPSLPKKLVRVSTPRLSLTDESDTNLILLKMEFNGAIPKSKLKNVRLDRIESISLAYSRYRLSDMFDQLTLNAQRMDKLYALLPGLKENTGIQWYWVEQTGCDNADACTDVFHGFVIKLKSEKDILERETEKMLMEYYSSIYEGGGETKRLDSLISTGKVSLIKVCDTLTSKVFNPHNRLARIRGWNPDNNSRLARLLKEELKDSGVIQLDIMINQKGNLVSLENGEDFGKPSKILKLLDDQLSISPALYNRKKIPSRMMVTLYLDIRNRPQVSVIQKPILPGNEEFVLDKFLYTTRTRIVCDYKDTSPKDVVMPVFASTPDIIFKVFDRNKQWKNCLVVTDVTGSMYPYLAQFKAWHKLHLDANSGNHDFVFFNDGDNMADNMKVTGQVGGVYYVNTSQYYKLSALLNTSMQKGGGGDGPENNIEAVLKGLEMNPECKEVIMIADNWATPRDLSLLKKVRVPIRLVLCGAQSGINTAYLDMIRSNKGSIHTMEQDLYDLTSISERQEIELDGIKYRFSNGSFTMVKQASKQASVIRH